MIDVPDYRLIAPADWRWPHFSPAEMACKSDGSLKMDERFLDRLEQLRSLAGCALPVASGYRSPAHNAAVSDTGEDGPHTTGQAVDLSVVGTQARLVIGCAINLGFTGIGIRQHGDIKGRLVHLDTIAATASSPRPWVWTYNIKQETT